MTMNGMAQIVFYFVVLLGLAKPLGWYMARVYEGRPCGVDRIFSPVERLIYRLCAVRHTDEMDWKTYGIAMLLFNAAGLFALYATAARPRVASAQHSRVLAVSLPTWRSTRLRVSRPTPTGRPMEGKRR